MDYGKCSLPGGYIDETGLVHKEVELRSLTGREEELLVSMADQGAAVQVTSILACCVKRIGSVEPITSELIRNLLVADRQFLMLKLREMTFGDRVQATVSCPWQDCNTDVDITFNISNIPIKDARLSTQLHECELEVQTDGDPSRVCFRLPNGDDQEALIKQMSDNSAIATTYLLWRCIERMDDIESPSLEQVRDLSSSVRNQIEHCMQRLAPDVELIMQAECPECQRKFSIPFDLQAFFFSELDTSKEVLRREVHYLAYHYHWSEQEILSMSRDKRHEYIDVLSDEIDRMNNGVQSSAAI